MFLKKSIACILLTSLALTAKAQSIQLTIDSSLADLVLETACSGQPIDQQAMRAIPLLQTQIKHHYGLSDRYTMDAYIEGLEAAARCETLEKDLFRFRYAVEEKAQLEQAIAFLKANEKDIVDFVLSKTAPYFPDDKSFEGAIVLSAAGQSCGGFSMDGLFFIDVPCIAGSLDEEYDAVKTLSAHETYHALQYAFFTPFSEDISEVKTPADALNYLFLNLLLEGSAEFVADSREVSGEGLLAGYLRDFATKGYRSVDTNLRMVGYSAEILGQGEDTAQRIKDVYKLGFSGSSGQPFYYVGAIMAEHIEKSLGTEALVCIMSLSPEQFVLAYDHVASGPGSDAKPIGNGAVQAARELSGTRPSYTECL